MLDINVLFSPASLTVSVDNCFVFPCFSPVFPPYLPGINLYCYCCVDVVALWVAFVFLLCMSRLSLVLCFLVVLVFFFVLFLSFVCLLFIYSLKTPCSCVWLPGFRDKLELYLCNYCTSLNPQSVLFESYKWEKCFKFIGNCRSHSISNCQHEQAFFLESIPCFLIT